MVDYENIHIFVVSVMSKGIRDMENRIKVGNYQYIIRFNRFYVMEYVEVSADGRNAHSRKVAEFADREDARRMVWEHNGWGTPKTPLTNRF